MIEMSVKVRRVDWKVRGKWSSPRREVVRSACLTTCALMLWRSCRVYVAVSPFAIRTMLLVKGKSLYPNASTSLIHLCRLNSLPARFSLSLATQPRSSIPNISRAFTSNFTLFLYSTLWYSCVCSSLEYEALQVYLFQPLS